MTITKFDLNLLYYDLSRSNLFPKLFWLINKYYISLFMLNHLQIFRIIILSLFVGNYSRFFYRININLTIINIIVFFNHTQFSFILIFLSLNIFFKYCILQFFLNILLHLLSYFFCFYLHFLVHFIKIGLNG